MGDPNPNPDLETGTVLDGRYRLTGEIARGGFGMVYRARQLNIDREVAVKTIPPEFLDLPDVVERFKREAKLASRLSHPNTITVHDYGQHDDTLFLVMELLEGEDLADVLAREQTLPIDTIARIARQVLKSLTEAHEYNIVHRDLKPENIFLCEIGGESDFVKVVDFGIAKLAVSDTAPKPDRATARNLTVEGNTVGTPTYMSPEQAAGGEVDARTDLYALGVIMYEMACGHPPFDDDDPAALMRQHIFDAVPDFDTDAFRGGWMEAVVQRALAKDKGDRFADAPSFLEAIEQADEWQGVTAEQTGVEAAPVHNLGEDSSEVLEETTRHQTPGPENVEGADTIRSTKSADDGSSSSSVISVLEPSQEQEIILLDRPKKRANQRGGPRASAQRRGSPSDEAVGGASPDSHAAAEPGSDRSADGIKATQAPRGADRGDTGAGRAPSQDGTASASESEEWSWGGPDARRADGPRYEDALEDSSSSDSVLLAIILVMLVAAAVGGAFAVGLL